MRTNLSILKEPYDWLERPTSFWLVEVLMMQGWFTAGAMTWINEVGWFVSALFNGDGFESWENVWGTWNGITPGTASRSVVWAPSFDSSGAGASCSAPAGCRPGPPRTC